MKHLLTWLAIFFLGATFSVCSYGDASAGKNRNTPALRESVYKKLSSVQKAIEEEAFQEAEKKLTKLLESGRLNSYEKAQAYNTQAFLFYSQEEYSRAITSYQAILQQDNIPLVLELTSRYSLAQLYSAEEQYVKALDMLAQWFTLNKLPSASALALRAQLEYQLNKKILAYEHIQQAIALYREKNKTPKEQWWLLLRAIYYDNENFSEMIVVMEYLVKAYPKPEYWLQLANLYGQQQWFDKQLQTLDSAYIKGYLKKESQLLQLAYLLIEEGTPYRAGEMVEEGINNNVIEKTEDNWRLLATAWYNAKEIEKAIVAMEKMAALSSQSRPYEQLASLYLSKDRYQEAIQAAESALDKKNTDRVKVYTLLGSAYLYSHRYSEAINAFEVAIDQSLREEKSSTQLSQWLEHAKQEKERYHLVKEYL